MFDDLALGDVSAVKVDVLLPDIGQGPTVVNHFQMRRLCSLQHGHDPKVGADGGFDRAV